MKVQWTYTKWKEKGWEGDEKQVVQSVLGLAFDSTESYTSEVPTIQVHSPNHSPRRRTIKNFQCTTATYIGSKTKATHAQSVARVEAELFHMQMVHEEHTSDTPPLSQIPPTARMAEVIDINLPPASHTIQPLPSQLLCLPMLLLQVYCFDIKRPILTFYIIQPMDHRGSVLTSLQPEDVFQSKVDAFIQCAQFDSPAWLTPPKLAGGVLRMFQLGWKALASWLNMQRPCSVFSMTDADQRHIGYDTSIYQSLTGERGMILDLANSEQGLDNLQLQLVIGHSKYGLYIVLHMSAKVNSCGSMIRLLKVANTKVANFYSGGSAYKSPPGMNPGDREFGIICKDSWEVAHLQDLSEGMILQLLHAKGIQGVPWCLDETPVLAPDSPTLPEDEFEILFLDNTLYTHFQWGIRALELSKPAKDAAWSQHRSNPATKNMPAISATMPPSPVSQMGSSGLEYPHTT
ncbi:hypothetical protein BDR03DRAFT_979714 [Suillus americanus]|nr:hypothetical protein BDR03DRAFT_979714 [Suillus americanus]